MGKKSTKLGVASLIAAGAGIAAVAAKSKKTEEKKRVKEIQKEEHDTFRNTERGKYTKNSKGIYYSNGNYEAFARPEKPEGADRKSAYIIGTGLAGLSAAFYLVRDGQVKGEHIHLLEKLDLAGGSCDGRKDVRKGFYMRGGREMDNHFECMWDMFRDVPSIETPGVSVLDEYYQVCLAQQYIAEGGIGYAKELLEKALGNEKAQGVISKLTASLQVRPFEFVRKTEPAQLLNFIQDEHPQTIAMILSYLSSSQAAMILGALPPEKQADVARRIAQMDRTSPDVIKEVERVLERKLSSLVNQDYTIVGGIDSIVNILNSVDRATEKRIMESLEVDEPELAEDIRKKMFVFEDILLLDDRSIQRVLRDVENADLELALKSSTEEIQNVVFRNLSKRLAAMIKEDMDFMGPVRMKDVEDAQQKIVAVIRKLEDSGDIVISRGGGDDIVV